MDILIPAAVLAGIGFVLGYLIYLVDKFFHVEEDPHIDEVLELLPRYNCGACGYPGCKEMAISLLANKTKPEQCNPLKKEAEEVLRTYLDEYFASKS